MVTIHNIYLRDAALRASVFRKVAPAASLVRGNTRRKKADKHQQERKMTKRRTFLKAAVAAGSVALAGIAATAPAAADELATIQEKGVIRIAMSGAYPPFNFVNDQNEVVGFDPAIGTEIAKRMGVEAEIVTTAWDGIIGGLLANKYDAIVGSMTITDERDEVVDFVGPYYTTKRAIFTQPGSEFTSIDQLGDAEIGVTLGETHEEWAREQGWNIRTYKGLPELLLELENGRVDAIVNDSIAAILAMGEKGRNTPPSSSRPRNSARASRSARVTPSSPRPCRRRSTR